MKTPLVDFQKGFFIEEMRKIVSLKPEINLEVLRDEVEIELVKQDPAMFDLTHIRWPHQSFKDAVMGHIFFPLQFELLYEAPSVLITRTSLQRLLAISASYGNTLAQILMKDVFDTYRGSSKAKFVDYFGLKAESQLSAYTCSIDPDPIVHKVPCYLGGLLSPGSPLGRGYFEKGWVDYKDVRCGEYYISSLKGSKRKEIWEGIAAVDPGLGLILEQRYFVKDRAKRKELALEAATKYGNAEGYYVAGLLGMEDRSFLLDCFLKAAEPSTDMPGRPWLYNDIARIHLASGDRFRAIASYIRMAQLGATDGYLKAAELYYEDGNEEKAYEFFEKAVKNNSYWKKPDENSKWESYAEKIWEDTYKELVRLTKVE